MGEIGDSSGTDIAALMALGERLVSEQKPGEALAVFERVIALEPESADAHCNRGVVLWQLGHAKAALACFGHALRLNPNHPESLENLRILGVENTGLDSADGPSLDARESVGAGTKDPEDGANALQIAIDLIRKFTGRRRSAIVITETRSTYDIIIPIYNAYEHIERCVSSVLKHSDPQHRVILLNDASTDPRVSPLLEKLKKQDMRIHVVHNKENVGFIKNVNAGFRISKNDVVILNSDTEVTPGWLERMDRCRWSDAAIGIVSPLSNNATILSVPIMNTNNHMPAGMASADIARVIAENSGREYPRIPTAVGFCMLITRKTLDKVGEFDTAYGLGYGEECDFCMRAWSVGIETACCDDAYVHHYGEASFGGVQTIDSRRKENARLLSERWPHYDFAIAAYCRANPLRHIQEKVRTSLALSGGETRPHVMHVIHSLHAPGGTEQHTKRIIEAISGSFRATVLLPERKTDAGDEHYDFRVSSDSPDCRVVELGARNIDPELKILGIPSDIKDERVEEHFFRFLAGGDYDIVHFQHLMNWNSLRLPLIAKALGKRVVISLHDYYLLCPDYNLLLPELHRCGRSIANGSDPGCMRCISAKREVVDASSVPDLSGYLAARRKLAAEVFAAADVVIAPSSFVKEKFSRAFGRGLAERIRVIPHGVFVAGGGQAIQSRGHLRVGFLGNFIDRKGAHLFLDAAERLRAEAMRFEVFGGVSGELRRRAERLGIRLRGAYTPGQLRDKVGQLDLLVVPSIWDETYCMTVSEAQAIGVPVVAADVGAIPERIVEGETGFLFPSGDAGALAERLKELSRDRGALGRVRAELAGRRCKTIERNGEEYAAVYSELLGAEERSPRFVRKVLGLSRADTGALQDGGGGEAYRRWTTMRGEGVRPGADVARGPFSGVEVGFELILLAPGNDPFLSGTIHSLCQLQYGSWRLNVVSDASPPEELRVSDDKFRWMREERDSWRSIVNDVVGAQEKGWVAVLQPGDRLSADALAILANYIRKHEAVCFVYVDEDRIQRDGKRCNPLVKPDFNIEMARSEAYVGRLCFVRRDAVRAVGGMRGVDELCAYDLLLRILERFGAEAIGHVPEIVHHVVEESSAPIAVRVQRGMEVVAAHLERLGIAADVVEGIAPETWRVLYRLADPVSVTVVIYGGVSPEGVRETLRSVVSVTDYPNFKIAVVGAEHDASVRRELETYKAGGRRVEVVGAVEELQESDARYFLFLRAGVVAVQKDWLTRMVAQALQPGVSIVGARVVGLDQRSWGIGMVLGLGGDGIAAPLEPGLFHGSPGYMGRAQVSQDMSAVSGLCMLVDGALYRSVGCDLAAGIRKYVDVEICLRAREGGRRVVWSPYATVVAHTVDLGVKVTEEEVDAVWRRWRSRLINDPAFSPTLSLLGQAVALEGELPRWNKEDRDERRRVLGMWMGAEGAWEYRGRQPLKGLAQVGQAQTAEVPAYRDRVRVPTVTELERLDIDTVLFYNAFHEEHLLAMRKYRRRSRAQIVFGLDDLLTELPVNNPLRNRMYGDIKKRVRDCLSQCQRLIVSTEPLRDYFGRYAEDVIVVPNYLDARWRGLGGTRRRGGKARVGWVGALQHAGDLRVLVDVVRSTAKEVDWVFMGMCPEEIRPYIKEFHGPVPYLRYPEYLSSLRLDVAVAPLEINRFNTAKSNLRILEYGACGYPVICTDIAPYRGGPVFRIGNQSQAWVEAIRERAHDLDAAAAEGDRLRAWVHSHWMLEDHLDQWLAALKPGAEAAPVRPESTASVATPPRLAGDGISSR